MRVLLLTLLLMSGSAFASSYPELCEDADFYDESTLFVRAPAMFGGCIGNLIGLPLGFIIGLPLGHPIEAAAISGAIINSGFHTVIGAPFYALEYVPRAVLEDSQANDSI